MWATDKGPQDDPLRQGDLLSDVLFPILKAPLPTTPLENNIAIVVPGKRKLGLVVSQCCDNERGDYVAIAQVQPTGRLSEDVELALMNYEPVIDELAGNFVVEQFRLEPIDQILEAGGPGHHVAMLNRTVVLWGPECASLSSHRIARMTAEGRRLLRINLLILWARSEAGDEVDLANAGKPYLL